MTTTSAIVHLIGYPAAGKYTVAQELARQANEANAHFVVIDNHFTANVIFGVMEMDGLHPIPDEVWDRVEEVREAVFRTIETLSPLAWSFVFTNVLTEGHERDAAAVVRLAQLASATQRRYVPVRLHCDVDELTTRIVSEDRKRRLKWIDPEGVRRFATEHELIGLDGHDALDLDVTNTPPETTAASILVHATRR
jgi:shikimate kinase